MENETLEEYFFRKLTKDFTLFESDTEIMVEDLSSCDLLVDIEFYKNYIWLCENDYTFQQYLNKTNELISDLIDELQDHLFYLIELYEFKRNQTGPILPSKTI